MFRVKKMAQSNTARKICFVITVVVYFIILGLLIYLCIYLTEYRPNSSTTALVSNTNQTQIATQRITSNNVIKTIYSPLEDDDDDTVIYASVPSFKKAMIPTLTRASVPVLTKVVVHTKANKKVKHVPEEITLHHVNQ